MAHVNAILKILYSSIWLSYAISTPILPVAEFTLISAQIKNVTLNSESMQSNTSSKTGRQMERLAGCKFLDLHVPEERHSLLICLRPLQSESKIFHQDFRVVEYLTDGQQKATTLDDLEEGNSSLVTGFVLSLIGYSQVTGTLTNGVFHGTVLYAKSSSMMRFCKVSPVDQLKILLDDYDEDELQDLLETHSAEDKKLDSVITCHDEISPDQARERILRQMKYERDAVRKRRRREAEVKRVKRDEDDEDEDSAVDSNTNGDPVDTPRATAESEDDDDIWIDSKRPPVPQQKKHLAIGETFNWMRSVHRHRDPRPKLNPIGVEGSNSRVPFMGRAAAGVKGDNNDKPADNAPVYGFNSSIFSSKPQGRHMFFEVAFLLDQVLLGTHFKDVKTATTLLSSYVDMADWMTRSHDFDGDGTPDNIGFKLKEIGMFEPEKDEISPFMSYRGEIAGTFFHKRAQESKKFKSIVIAIAPINSPLYLHMAMTDNSKANYDGCTVCAYPDMLDGLINTNAVRFSARGETLRMLHAVLRVLISSIVYTKEVCMDCVAKDSGIEAEGGDVWGACLVEGILYDSSNIPLNAFRLSDCSLQQGKQCLTDVQGRKVNAGSGSDLPCVQLEAEPNYCGNGILEPGEECDCGSLSTCMLDKCKCGPRNGIQPCMELDATEEQVCQALIRCRGFRFLHELGQLNASHFLDSIPALMFTRISSSDGSLTTDTCKALIVFVIFNVTLRIYVK